VLVQDNISQVAGKISNSIKKKCLCVLDKNSSFKILEDIYEMFNGNFEID
jgi:F0F1-type ATP synthase delta subunit